MAFFKFFKTKWRKEPIITDIKSENNEISAYKYKTHLELRFQDFDLMGHVNNAVYFTLLEIGRTKYWKHAISWDWEKTGVIIAEATVKYLKPVYFNDKVSIYVRTSKIGRSSFDLQYILVKMANGEEVVCSEGKTICVAFDYHKKHPVPIPDIERNKMVEFEQLIPPQKEHI